MFRPKVSRRKFVRDISAFALAASFARTADAGPEDAEVLADIETHRPSRLSKLPKDFAARVGSAHVSGRYCLGEKPFLIEGAERLLALGTRLGKFWFEPDRPERSYPFHSKWKCCRTLVELAKSDYFEQLLRLPFQTILLEAFAPAEHGWDRVGLPLEFYAAIEREYYEVALHFLRSFHERTLTVVLQNWEGDWMLRGGDKKWTPPPSGWQQRCEAMQRWLAARQAGVAKARAEMGAATRCVVAHAAEVNRVDDGFKGIPTMTRNVLPAVEVDLVSYSAYDGMNGGPVHFWKCLNEIRTHARTGPLFGPGALAVGEFGIPENASPRRIAERYDEALGVMLAADVRYAAHWQLYCNEFANHEAAPGTPVADPSLLRGFWLVKPDGSLSEGGKYFSGLWHRVI